MGEKCCSIGRLILSARQAHRADLLPGIVIGAINRLYLNEWRSNGSSNRSLWQLIAIFDKVNEFPVPGNLVLKKPAPAAGGQQLATDRFTHKKRN